MKGIQYLMDSAGNKTAILIDLKNHDTRIDDILEDMFDLIACEKVKKEESVPFSKAVNALFKKGKLSKAVHSKVMNKNV